MRDDSATLLRKLAVPASLDGVLRRLLNSLASTLEAYAMNAIRIHQPGGPEQLHYEDTPPPVPGPDDVLVKLEAIGVNFIDVYHRTGLYKVPPPFTPGMEGAGIVDKVGERIIEWNPGDRVAWAMSQGAYAEYAIVPAAKLVRVPDGVDTRTAAALMLQGMTAHYLTRSTFPLKAGHTALVHAAAGGAGLLITQLAKAAGARVIGTVSTDHSLHAAGFRNRNQATYRQQRSGCRLRFRGRYDF
jgi:NADPH:quinone reductase